jgi:hypothetical protein
VTQQLLLTAALLLSLSAHADPGYYLVTPYDNAGVRTVEARYWSVTRPGRPQVAWPEMGVSLGLNSRWTSGLLWSWIGPSGGPYSLSTVNWSNDVLLTQGEWPLDLALHTMWVRDRADPDGGALEFGPLMQTDFGRVQLNANLVFEHGLGHARDKPVQLKYQWQLRYRWQPGLHWGMQGFGELGPWRHWDPHRRQSHRAGPAVFGTLPLADREALVFSAAWLEGRTYRRSGHMLSLRTAWTF